MSIFSDVKTRNSWNSSVDVYQALPNFAHIQVTFKVLAVRLDCHITSICVNMCTTETSSITQMKHLRSTPHGKKDRSMEYARDHIDSILQ